MDPPEGDQIKKSARKHHATAPGAYFEQDDDVEQQLLPEFKDQVRPSCTEDSAPKSNTFLYQSEPHGKVFHKASSSEHATLSFENQQPSGPRYKDQVAMSDGERIKADPRRQEIQQWSGPRYKDQVAEAAERFPTNDQPHAQNELQASCEEVTSASNRLHEEGFLVSARVVEESTLRPLAQAVPVQEINKRRAAVFLGLAMIILAVIIIPTVYLVPNKSDESKSLSEPQTSSEPPDITSQHPTEASTDLEVEWMQLGDAFGPFQSEDRAGYSVAISRNGLSTAVGAPGTGDGTVRIYRYKAGIWDELAKIDEIDSSWRNGTGTSVAMDDTGLIIAIGAPFASDDDNYYDSPSLVTSAPSSVFAYGRVQVFEINKTATSPYDVNSYRQIGSDIFVPEVGSEFGWSVDISGTGDVVAIGSRSNCYVKVVRFSEVAQDWQDFGNPINCTGTFDNSFGTSVRLSSNGNVLAVGAPVVLDNEAFWSINDIPIVDDTSRKGRVRVFQNNGTSWTMMGSMIEGEAAGDGFGFALALSDDGTVLASCAPFNDVGQDPISTGDSSRDPSFGSCRVYRYNASQDSWQQLGQDIDGEEEQDKFGTSVSLNAAGTVIAIGAIGSGENGDDSGHVRVFQFDEEDYNWIQVGKDIPGPFLESVFGRSVALSADGDLVIVGSPNDVLVNDDHKGSARVFETGIAVKSGDFPIKVTIHTGEDPDYLGWVLQRIDVEREETFGVISVPIGTYAIQNQTITSNTTVPEGGVFMFAIVSDSGYGFCCEDSNAWYEITFPIENGDDITIVQKQGNFTTRKIHTFQAIRELDSAIDSALGQATVTFVIDFDDYPEEFHWVLVQSDLVMDPGSTKLKSNRTVLAFGPEQEYSTALRNAQQIETIDVSLVTADSILKLIITDDGRDGLCCEFGAGMFRLYNGTYEENNEGNLLVSSTAEGKRREVHSIRLFGNA